MGLPHTVMTASIGSVPSWEWATCGSGFFYAAASKKWENWFASSTRSFYQLRHSRPEANVRNEGAQMVMLRCSLAVIVALIFSMSLAAPPEDVLEMVYDESDCQPCNSKPVFSIAALGGTARVASARVGTGWGREKARDYDYTTNSGFPISDSLNIIHRSLRC